MGTMGTMEIGSVDLHEKSMKNPRLGTLGFPILGLKKPN
jgi:hypothetical protein